MSRQMKRVRGGVVLVAVVVGLFGIALPARAPDAILKSTLSGANLVPGPGDPDGSGESTIYIDADTNRICASITVRHIAPATAAHIHIGAAGENGPHAVDLLPPTNGFVFYCTTADPAMLEAISTQPQNFYLNVHNDPYPNGALRGQLRFA